MGSGPNVFVHIALLGWIPLVLVLFMLLPPRRAVIAATIGAWLFLPMWGYDLPSVPDYTKVSATSVALLLGVMLFDSARLLHFRLRWLDLPMVVWVVAPSISSLVNGIGFYDAMSALLGQIVMWGLPYFIGRLYFTDLESVRELAIGVFIGGLVYAPLCLFEVRMSPQLHRMVYGYTPFWWAQTIRGGGYRPVVFMQHGLMVGMWMAAASLVGAWLWWSGALKRLWGMSTGWLVLGLVGTTVLCKSTGALALLVIGLGVLALVKWLRRGTALVLLAAAPLVYIGARLGGFPIDTALVGAARMMISEDRASSLRFRMTNEDMLMEQAMRRPVFGWGRWGEARVRDERGEDISTTDGLWIIILGNYGLVGLAGLSGMLLLPAAWLRWRYPARAMPHPAMAGALAMAVMVVLYMLDNLMNAMLNPVFLLMAGAVASVCYAPVPRAQATRVGAEPGTIKAAEESVT